MPTEILSLDEIIENQASKYVTHNTALRQLEGQLVRVLSKTVDEPASPTNGDTYIVPAGAAGANWVGQDGNIAHYFGGSWKFYVPKEGVKVWVNDEDRLVVHDGTSWTYFGMSHLGDVDLSSPSPVSDGDVLAYDAPSQQWYPAAYQRVHAGASAERPANPKTGQMFFDTTLGKPVWWDGAQWVDATGAAA